MRLGQYEKALQSIDKVVVLALLPNSNQKIYTLHAKAITLNSLSRHTEALLIVEELL
jgi:hypothetical protein